MRSTLIFSPDHQKTATIFETAYSHLTAQEILPKAFSPFNTIKAVSPTVALPRLVLRSAPRQSPLHYGTTGFRSGPATSALRLR